MNDLVILNNWEKAKNAIAICHNIDDVKKIKDQTEALRSYAKQAKEGLEVQNNIADIKLRAERKIGELSKEIPKSKSNQYAKSHDVTKQIKLSDIGLNKQDASRYEAIASLPKKDFEKHVSEVKASNKELTTVGVIKLAKELKREQSITEQKGIIESGINTPKGKYDLIVFDPPWSYGAKYNPQARRVANPYPEMSNEEIKDIEIPANKDCILWFWTTHKFIWNAKEIMDSWGFEYKGILTWNKEKMGMGDWFRMQCEFCLLGIKGKPLWNVNNLRDIISEPRREHSRKPESFYKMIDKNFVGKKLDYFSRQQRKGWEVFGNDINKYVGR